MYERCPKLEDFNLTDEEVKKEKENRKILEKGTSAWGWCIFFLFFIGIAPLIGLYKENRGLAFCILICIAVFTQIKHSNQVARIKSIRINEDYDSFLAAYAHWETQQVGYWMGITGFEFEKRVAKLLANNGYCVEVTQATNDGGIDIIAKKSNDSLAIQCKCHKKPIGPMVARELYGVMCSREKEFNGGVLVCPSGFTKGVHEFVKGKPIELIELSDLIQLAKTSR